MDTSNSSYFPGHINSLGPQVAPAVSLCGTGVAGVATGTDNSGKLTPGYTVTGATSCVMTFNQPFNLAPNCVFTNTISPAAAGSVTAVTPVGFTTTTTGVIFTQIASGAVYMFVCLGNQ
jgi:hypothetical protein